MRDTIAANRVFVSSVINAPISRVWALTRDFDGLPKWHPAIAQSHIESGVASNVVGCVRHLVLKGGENVRERLLELSDITHRFVYNIIESDVGLLDYVATFELLRITDGERTFAAWTAQFRTASGLEHEKMRMVEQDVFGRGFEALKVMLL